MVVSLLVHFESKHPAGRLASPDRPHHKAVYRCLFQAAAQALQKLARSPRFVGGQIGMIHFWSMDSMESSWSYIAQPLNDVEVMENFSTGRKPRRFSVQLGTARKSKLSLSSEGDFRANAVHIMLHSLATTNRRASIPDGSLASRFDYCTVYLRNEF